MSFANRNTLKYDDESSLKWQLSWSAIGRLITFFVSDKRITQATYFTASGQEKIIDLTCTSVLGVSRLCQLTELCTASCSLMWGTCVHLNTEGVVAVQNGNMQGILSPIERWTTFFWWKKQPVFVTVFTKSKPRTKNKFFGALKRNVQLDLYFRVLRKGCFIRFQPSDFSFSQMGGVSSEAASKWTFWCYWM